MLPDAAAGFRRWRLTFEAARQRRPSALTSMWYRIAGHSVQVRIAGGRLAAVIAEGWRHLEPRPPAPPASTERPLHVDLWDAGETAVAATTSPVAIDPAERFPFRVSADCRFVAHAWPRVLSWLDRGGDHVVGCVEDAAELTPQARGRLVEPLLLVWLRDRSAQLVHAGLVARGPEGLLLLGRSGAGKSTAALACALAGFAFLGDDKVALSPGPEGAWEGHSLTGVAYLEPGQLARFPDLAPWRLEGSTGDGKALLPLGRVPAVRLVAGAHVRALAIVRIGEPCAGGPRPASRRDALLAAGLSTVLHLPIDQARALPALGDLVRRLPAYWLDLGPDPADIPRRAGAILDAADG
jgi:hypothetical protein